MLLLTLWLKSKVKSQESKSRRQPKSARCSDKICSHKSGHKSRARIDSTKRSLKTHRHRHTRRQEDTSSTRYDAMRVPVN